MNESWFCRSLSIMERDICGLVAVVVVVAVLVVWEELEVDDEASDDDCWHWCLRRTLVDCP